MNYLYNYIKRDEWLRNGKNYGIFLRTKDGIEKLGVSPRKAHKMAKAALWRMIKAGKE